MTGYATIARMSKEKKSQFQSAKLFSGFSVAFRQWRATQDHCRFIHGYGVSFKVWFAGEVDYRNWVFDFGGLKRSNHTIDGMQPKAWMHHVFDHTLIVAEDDPELADFKVLDEKGVVQLRVLPDVSCEYFAKEIFEKMNPFVVAETAGRVRITQVEFFENPYNSAIFLADDA